MDGCFCRDWVYPARRSKRAAKRAKEAASLGSFMITSPARCRRLVFSPTRLKLHHKIQSF